MPVIINDMQTEVTSDVVPASTSAPIAEAMPVSQPEFELLQTLSVMNERQARLLFD